MLPRSKVYLKLLAEMKLAVRRSQNAQDDHPEGSDFIDGALHVTEYWYERWLKAIEKGENMRIEVRKAKEGHEHIGYQLGDLRQKKLSSGGHRQSQRDEKG